MICDLAGHDFEDAGGGLEIRTECHAERWAKDTGQEQVPDTTIRRYREGA